MLEPGNKAVRIIVSGHVQGVWFRDWTVRNATDLLLDGWVRNRTDGTLEALFVGKEDNVNEMLKRCEVGPEMARVKNIDLQKARGITAAGFIQKPTVDISETRNN